MEVRRRPPERKKESAGARRRTEERVERRKGNEETEKGVGETEKLARWRWSGERKKKKSTEQRGERRGEVETRVGGAGIYPAKKQINIDIFPLASHLGRDRDAVRNVQERRRRAARTDRDRETLVGGREPCWGGVERTEGRVLHVSRPPDRIGKMEIIRVAS